MPTWKFVVVGDPVPKGSAKAFMRKGMRFPVVIQDNAAKQKPWASVIAFAAVQAKVQPINAGPVRLSLRFFMRRPKQHYGSDGAVRARCQNEAHTKKPDLDKLIRCVKDALKGVAYNDDSQVDETHATKEYVCSGKPGEQNIPGCIIILQGGADVPAKMFEEKRCPGCGVFEGCEC